MGTAIQPVTFQVGSSTSLATDLAVTAVSSNQALLPNSGIVLGGSGQNRLLSLTPVSGAAGESTITVTVQDGDQSTVRSFKVDVTPVSALVPVVTSAPTTNAYVDQSYTYSIIAQPGDPSRSLAITSTQQLPSWLTLTDNGDGTAMLTGTPSADLIQSGTSLQIPIALAVTDSTGLTTTQDFNLVVNLVQITPPTLNAATPPDAEVNSPYTLNISANLGSQSQTLAIAASQSLPSSIIR